MTSWLLKPNVRLWHIADGLAPARSGQVSRVVPPFAERTLATTECFDFGDQCTVLPTRNGDYGRSREVARRQLASDGSYAEGVLSGNVLWKCARTLESGFGVGLPFADSLAVRYCRSLEARAMDFRLSTAQQRLQQKCRELAEDFATRSAGHDRDASHPIENYQRLRDEGFLALSVAREWGGSGASFLDHTIAYEALGQGCPSTALAFNMHASVVMPLLQSTEISAEIKQRIAKMVVHDRNLIAGNFSEPITTSLIGARPLKTRARRIDGGYSVSGRKMFASMLEAADYVLVMAYPDEATTPFAGIILMLPRVIEGRSVEPDWDVLGMRATRSDSLILDECRLPDDAVVFRSEDTRSFRHAYLNWFWGSYTAVYLGLATAAYDELRRVVHTRQPEGYAQPLAYHPDVRRHVAEMSVDLEAARLITYRSAWLSDTEGPTAETTAALYRAKYMVGEAVTRITRAALTLGGAHGIFKGSRLEQLFRDGALAPLHPPPADYCLYNMGFFELGLDPADTLPPLKPM